ncbi:ribose 5-phosphate isomerase B [Flexithrix dorotheae]|uniref:ribose 5-phosphate isomerase B n=1 Tax=Flexithrix dorotheae TaxID=70993 RepID=UPI00035C63D6|nr:ribose 5-phosphate isomerase B [Flexithrix dorotheae]
MKIAIGGDHAGFGYKRKLIPILEKWGHTVTDFGTNSEDSVDYPDFAHPVASAVEKGDCEFGILICGTGNGVAITANKHEKIRAGLCWNAEVATLIRQHNDANVLSMPARFISLEEAEKITQTFLNTAFEGGRHARRVGKMSC